jgi:hypothetical protein
MVAAAEAGALHLAGATFGELCEEWFTHAGSYLAPNTLAETRRILGTALLRRLGGVSLAGVHPPRPHPSRAAARRRVNRRRA